MRRLTIRDAGIIIAVALCAGAPLAAIQTGPLWRAWLAFSVLLALGLAALLAAWRWAGAGRPLAWMIGLALVLRIGAGVGAYLALPINGYNEPDDRAGFVFTDAHRRDDQAWELASSNKPIWAAFDKSYYTDQYGGMLALSALAYKTLSPDAHRPLLVLSLAALAAALGLPFFFKAAGLVWGERLAGLAGWLYALYPESVLTGGAQMREPFLLTLIAIVFYGFAKWQQTRGPRSASWMAGGLLGMLLISPGIAVVALVLFAVWWRLGAEDARLRWPWLVGASVILLAAAGFLVWTIVSRESGGGPVGASVSTWLKDSVNWVVYQLERGSGQVQNVFSKLGAPAQFLFVIGYGVTQPVLPPAFFEPTTTTWRIIAISRALGWYAVLPLLLYAPAALRHVPAGSGRRVWAWLTIFSWAWIVICAIRAGGDQWDNPRYRLIFFGIEALVVAFAWSGWRDNRGPWLPRILAAEIWCVLVFGQWYVARYYLIGVHLPIMVVLSLCIAGVAVVLGGGAIWDMRAARSRSAT
ncbi:MAG: hypothetical protein ACK2UU_09665 [Anaerolineae bacterium]|jgi:hypothetical protein